MQVEVQLQASTQAEHQRNLDEQTEESRIKAEVQRRLKAERQLLEKEAKAIEEKDERDVFLPPVF